MNFTNPVQGQSLTPYIQGTANITSNVPGWSGKTLSFPGTAGNYINLGNTHPAHINSTANNIFIECWVNASSFGSGLGFIFAVTGGSISSEEYSLWMSANYGINWHVRNTSDVSAQVQGGTITTNQWYHVAGTWNYSTQAVYAFVNGSNINTSTLTGTPRYNAASTVQIGAANQTVSGDYYPFSGYIRDLRVIQGGTPPTTSFTPDSNLWRYGTIPSYVTGGTNVFGLYGQYLGNITKQLYPSAPIYVGPTGTTPSTYTTVSAPTFTSSNVSFTGSTNVSGNYIDFGTTTINRSLGISIVATVNFRSLSTWQRICEIFLNSGNTDNFGIAQDATNNWLKFLFLANSGTDYSVWSTAIPFTAGVPFTVVCIYNPNDVNGQRLSIYMNGALAGSTLWTAGTIPSGTITYTNAYVGRSAYAPDYYANMDLTFLKIYNRVLTSTEIGYLGASPQIYLAPTQYYPSYTVGSAPTVSGSSFTFTGSTNVSGNYLNYPNTSFNMTNGFSFIATFYFTSSTNWQRLFDFGNGAPSDNILLAQSGTSTNFSFNVCSGTTQNIITAGTITFGTYQTVAGVYDPSILNFKMYLYVNGTLVGSLTPTSRISGTRTLTNCYVGRSNWAADYYANMSLTFLNMYNRVLTPDEIANPPSGAIISVTAPPKVSSIPKMYYTGLPLFSQLSPAVLSTVQNLYSLRSLKASYVKAVNLTAQYPQGAFTTYITSYGTASASSEYPPGGDNPYAWKAFNKVTASPQYWASAANYTQGVARTSGASTVAGGTTYYGDWIQIQLPSAIVPTSYSIASQDGPVNTPGTWYLFGSLDGSTWTLLDTRSGIASSAFTTGVFNTYTITGVSVAYLYFRIVCNIVSNNSSFALSEWILNRTADFYADRLGNLLTAPITGQTVSVYFGGASTNISTWYDQSGNGYDMTQTQPLLQPLLNLSTTPASITFTGSGTTSGQYLLNTSYSFTFSTNYQYTIRAVINNTVGGLLVYKGKQGAPWNSTGEKQWYLGPSGTATQNAGNYPDIVGYAEGWFYTSTPITTAKTSVTWSSSAYNSITIYENTTSVSATNSGRAAQTDAGTYLYFGITSAGSPYYNGNVYEIEIFSSTLGSTDVSSLNV